LKSVYRVPIPCYNWAVGNAAAGSLAQCKVWFRKVKVVEILFYNSKRVKLVVEMPDPSRYSTAHAPHIPRLLFKLFPHLARHRCENDNGYSFRRECQETEIPHLFEHLIIELQGQAQRVSNLKGETEWNWRVDPRGRFHVYVDYDNEMLVLGAIRAAERIINALDSKSLDEIDTQREVTRLRELAALGAEIRGPLPVEEKDGATAPCVPVSLARKQA
jgi:hypothetical protein